MTPKKKKQLQAELTIAHGDHEKGLSARALFKLGDNTMSKDMVQETFMKTWVYLAKGGKVDTMKAFLYHVLNHLIIDEYRRHKTDSLEVLVEKGFEPSTDEAHRLPDFLDGKNMMLLIARLPVSYQKVMRMKYIQDLTLREMSLITGKSKNAMAVQLHRGLEKLKILCAPL